MLMGARKPTPLSPRARTNAQPASIPSPIGGLNVRDGLAAMDARFAIQMTDAWPSAWGVFVRNGWQVHCEVNGEIHTLLSYSSPDGTEKLFAASNDLNIYDVTASSTTPPVSHTTAYPHIQWTNFGNVFGHYLICVNGAEAPFYYNGTAWAALTITGDLGDATDPEIPTPLDPTKLIDVNVFKRRLWFVEKDSARAWYLATDTIQGAASLFDLSEVFPRGGYLIDVGTWTVDTGTGINDNLVFLSSEGDIALFSGIDPDTDFTLIGIYQIAQPINRRSLTQRGGDLLIATTEGILSMAAIMAEQSELEARTITDLIKPLLSAISNDAASILDWQMIAFNKYEMLLYNTRDVWGTIVQYAMNTTTKAWTQFTTIPASCWGVMENEPYFGGIGIVARFWKGSHDATTIDGVVGSYVEAKVIQAYSYFGSPGQQKHFRMLRPVIRAGSQPGVDVRMLVDFNGVNPTQADDPTSLVYNFGEWDVSLWDEALWGQNSIPFLRWYGGGTIGIAGAVAISLKCGTPYCVWVSTDIVAESGGVL